VNILGISAFYHDSAAALVRDGDIVAAAQEERFTRKRHDERFPENAVRYCLKEAGITAKDLDAVVFYEKPLLKFERLLETYVAFAPRGLFSFFRAMPPWLQQKLHLPREIDNGLGREYRGPIYFARHHESHAASAFFPSPFEEAAILTLDGVGEWTTTSWGVGRGNAIELRQEIRFPHSLGLLYSAFTYYAGFRVNSGEYKLMGLAPYGTPIFAPLIREHLIEVRDDGSYRLDMRYFNYCQGLTMTNARFHRLLGGPPRKPDSPVTQRDMDLAASIQLVIEEVILNTARHVQAKTGLKNICLAGGVALNCVANRRLGHLFDNIWIMPNPGDAGSSLGAAAVAHGSRLNWVNAFLGHEIAGSYPVADVVAALLSDRIVGVASGRAEFGPRALGNRSLLADPRGPDIKDQVNAIKRRQKFRPFAPVILEELADRYFAMPRGWHHNRYMQSTADCRDPDLFPAVIHVDGSSRVQTVPDGGSGIRKLLEAWYDRTGCPMLLNTSLNIRGEPMVNDRSDADRFETLYGVRVCS